MPGFYAAREIVDFAESFSGQHLRSNPAASSYGSIDNYRLILIEFGQSTVQFSYRNQLGAGHMPAFILTGLTNIQEAYFTSGAAGN